MSYGKFASVYDKLMADMPYGEWLAFADELFRRYGKPAVLADLGCGTGSLAIPLAARGCTVFGIDLSEEMLAVAREKAEHAQRGAGALARTRSGGSASSVVWLQQDMREWDAGEQVDAVVSFCDSVCYLTEDGDWDELFRRTFGQLRDGGWFAFDVHTQLTLREYAEHQPFVLDEPEIAYIWHSGLDEEEEGGSCTIEHELVFFVRDGADGRFSRFEEVHRQRTYALDAVRERLLAAGFSRVEVFADFGWDAAAEDSTARAFFVAVK